MRQCDSVGEELGGVGWVGVGAVCEGGAESTWAESAAKLRVGQRVLWAGLGKVGVAV